MTQDDKLHSADIPAALGLLSRLPVRVDTHRAMTRSAQAAWAYPVAGLALGLIACTITQITLWVGVPVSIAAGVLLATLVITTGAMHEDGLADTADGLWGGWDKSRRLEIMKDSHIGAYGVIALAMGLGLRGVALAYVIDANLMWPAVIAAAMFSRATMVGVMSYLPHARDTGLSHMVGRPTRRTASIALAIGIIAAAMLTGFWPLLSGAIAALICAAIARAKIGGQTGDILGATQQITEIAVLVSVTALL